MEIKDVDSQTFTDGKLAWKVSRLIFLSQKLTPFDLPLKHLNIYNLYPKDIPNTMKFVKHVQQVNEADLSYPIILDDEGFVMDGRHRVLKALLTKAETIKAVRFDETPTACYEKEAP